MANRFDNLRVPVTANLRKNGNTPYYGANGIQDFVDGYTHDGEYILVAEDGANNLKNYPINYVSGRIWVNNHAHVLQAIPDLANTRFLGYEIGRSNIVSLLVGGGRAKLNADALMNMSINLPKMQEQELIAKIFKTIDHAITLHEEKKHQLDRLKSALLQKIFVDKSSYPAVRFVGFKNAWEQCKLGDVCEVYDGIHQTPDYQDHGIMFLSVENISTLTSNKFISREYFEQNFKIFPERGDILLTRIGNVGTPNVVEKTDRLAYYVSLALLKAPKIDSYFLCNLICTQKFKKELHSKTLTTAIPQKINKDEIRKVTFFNSTNCDEQKRIGLLLRTIHLSITLHDHKLELLKRMKQSLLQKMFI